MSIKIRSRIALGVAVAAFGFAVLALISGEFFDAAHSALFGALALTGRYLDIACDVLARENERLRKALDAHHAASPN